MKLLSFCAAFLMALPLFALTLAETKGEYQIDEEASVSAARLAGAPEAAIRRKLASWKGCRLVLSDKEVMITRGEVVMQKGVFRADESKAEVLTLNIAAARGPIELKLARKSGGISCEGLGAPGNDVIWKTAP